MFKLTAVMSSAVGTQKKFAKLSSEHHQQTATLPITAQNLVEGILPPHLDYRRHKEKSN